MCGSGMATMLPILDGLSKGFADFVRLKANYVPEAWTKPGEGTMWNQGHSSVAARFLDYCNDLRNGFVAELNKKMRDGYNVIFLWSCWGRVLISCGMTTKPSTEIN